MDEVLAATVTIGAWLGVLESLTKATLSTYQPVLAVWLLVERPQRMRRFLPANLGMLWRSIAVRTNPLLTPDHACRPAKSPVCPVLAMVVL